MDANLEPRWNDDELELLKDHLRRLSRWKKQLHQVEVPECGGRAVITASRTCSQGADFEQR